MNWHHKWFNEDYLNLYQKRDLNEASLNVEFIIQNLELKKGDKILDVGCGTGRHAFEFAKRGMQVTGVDSSSYFIALCKERVQVEPYPIEFIEADFLKIDPIGKFDVAVNLFTSFGYYEKDEENLLFLQKISSNLKEGGKFFLDYLNPSEIQKNLIPYEEKEVKGEKVIIQRSIENNKIIKDIQFPKRAYQERVSLYDFELLKKILTQSNLQLINKWDHYPNNPQDKRQLIYCSHFQKFDINR